jgi:glycosyltransferase involved in cell wall biosynthesis
MLYGRTIARRLARRQDEIIAISQSTARDVMKFYGISAERISVVHNGLDHERFCPNDPLRAKRWVEDRYGLSAPFFLYVARLEHPAKNHVRLIAAFSQFKAATRSPWQLVFAGVDGHGAEAVHRAIHQSPFASDIHSFGFVDDDHLSELYRAAAAFVYPSLFEGFGLPPLEAMACGCPVLSSNAGSLEEVLGGAALVLNPEDVTDMTEKLCQVAASPELRRELCGKGFSRARCFDWQKTAAKTLEVYERAVQPRTASFV